MKFTNEQIDYIKHCGEHFEVLIGGRGHSKTKQIIEQLQTENQQLKHNWNELKEWLKANDIHFAEAIPFRETLKKMEELEKESDVK